MIKKTILGIITVASFGQAFGTVLPAVKAPRYLMVQGFGNCLQKENSPDGAFSHWCMPPQKPDECSEFAWETLSEFTGEDRVPNCKIAD